MTITEKRKLLYCHTPTVTTSILVDAREGEKISINAREKAHSATVFLTLEEAQGLAESIIKECQEIKNGKHTRNKSKNSVKSIT